MTSALGVRDPDQPSQRALRRPDTSTILSLAPIAILLPISLTCASLFAAVPAVLLHIRVGWILLAYLLLGAVMFVPAVQEAVAGSYFKARRLTPEEFALIDGPWKAVLHRAGLDTSRYILRAQDSDEVNAMAAGGHVVCVTTTALRTLPPDELSGVLAHELGHHLGMHTVVSVIANWLLLPINAVLLIATTAVRVLDFFGAIYSMFGNGLVALVVRLMCLWLFLSALFVNLFVRLIMAFLAIFGRVAEYAADATAAELGLGHQLRRALVRFEDESPGFMTKSVMAALEATHPPLPKRIHRIDELMAGRTAGSIYAQRPVYAVVGVVFLAAALVFFVGPLLMPARTAASTGAYGGAPLVPGGAGSASSTDDPQPTPTPEPTPTPTPDPTPTPTPTPVDDPSSAAKQLDALLRESNTQRKPVNTAIKVIADCSNPVRGTAALQSAASRRRDLAKKLEGTDLSAMANGQQLATELSSALDNSARSDERFADWGSDMSDGCTAGRLTAAYRDGQRLGQDAKTDKETFVADWNSTAGQYGLRSDWTWGDI